MGKKIKEDLNQHSESEEDQISDESADAKPT
jgi:hypothetical protein